MEGHNYNPPPARSLINEIGLLYDNITDLIEEVRATNKRLDALLLSRGSDEKTKP